MVAGQPLSSSMDEAVVPGMLDIVTQKGISVKRPMPHI